MRPQIDGPDGPWALYGDDNTAASLRIRLATAVARKTGSKADPDASGDVVGQVVSTREFAVVIEIGGHTFI